MLQGCTADPTTQLERVAKDWSLTIRASQVIPVYPLTEDIQPGDVFLVPASISEQTRIYQDKGFLPIDQLVKRLPSPDYESFYGPSYWAADYASGGQPRTPDGNSGVNAPRTAFPSYSFNVDRSGGLKLALPIQGIPFGLGLVGAASAAGTVTISKSYTYGADGASVYRSLLTWFHSAPEFRQTLAAMASSTDSDIYLRVVTRVHLASEIDVSLAATDSVSGGVDGGVAQDISLPNLSSSTPGQVRAAGQIYQEMLQTLSAALNSGGPDIVGTGAGGTGAGGTDAGGLSAPGGSVRFTHLDRRSVSMKQTFDRPLAVGFVGFDVKVFRNGTLSAPIPSFAVLSGGLEEDKIQSLAFDQDDGLSDAYLDWLDTDSGNVDRMRQFLQELRVERATADVAFSLEFRSILQAAQVRFGF